MDTEGLDIHEKKIERFLMLMSNTDTDFTRKRERLIDEIRC